MPSTSGSKKVGLSGAEGSDRIQNIQYSAFPDFGPTTLNSVFSSSKEVTPAVGHGAYGDQIQQTMQDSLFVDFETPAGSALYSNTRHVMPCLNQVPYGAQIQNFQQPPWAKMRLLTRFIRAREK